jgi:hypothetical protein
MLLLKLVDSAVSKASHDDEVGGDHRHEEEVYQQHGGKDCEVSFNLNRSSFTSYTRAERCLLDSIPITQMPRFAQFHACRLVLPCMLGCLPAYIRAS